MWVICDTLIDMQASADDQDTADSAAPLDMLLTDAALGPLRRFVPGMSGVRLGAHLVARPAAVVGRGTELVGAIGRVATGRSALQPHDKDRRFRDPAWTNNPFLRRAVQSYLALGQSARGLVEDASLDWGDNERMKFIVDNLVDALAPSNNPFLNPLALRATIESGGRNVVDGSRRLVRDLSKPPRVPSMVEPDAFEVGEDLAVTPGSVVLRTETFELIQYAPQTPKVRTIPLLVVPPTINKYYIVDLADERSMVQHLLRSGQQVFMISWRNPRAEHADWGLDTYGASIIEAMDAVQKIARTDKTALFALCSGGMITAMLLGHLAAEGKLDRVAALTLAVTVLDQTRAGLPSALLSRQLGKAAIKVSASKGYLDGKTLAEVFAWLRPNDLIWSYWINNYLLGKPPKAFDILYWNADTVRMTAATHRQFIELAVSNALTKPGESTMLGSKIDLSEVDVDSYIVAGIADHLCQWQSCYQSTQLLGGTSKFVLSTSGHIASLVNPPGNEKASFQTAADNPPDAEHWLDQATKQQGSWWTDWADWLSERTGPERGKPRRMGCKGLEPSCDAPGTYIRNA